MTVKERIEHGLNKKEMEEFEPDQGIDISWHSDGTCTIIDSVDSKQKRDNVKKRFRKNRKLNLIDGIDTIEI